MKKEIYLIRHGQTDYNVKGIVQGKGVDSSLNERGVQQARHFFDFYREEGFEHIFISSLKRTHQTVLPFIDHGHSYEISPYLDEIDWGIYEGQLPTPEMLKNYTGIIAQWRSGALDTKIHGGESALDLYIRQQPFIEMMRSMDYNKVLICSHGRAIRSLLCGFLQVPLHEMDNFEHTNTCLYKLEYINGDFKLVLANDIQHLNGKN
ncbi:MAG: histidine phosphatase family protein [Chitinophagales bacterium]|nr:histidine phosphatase family protein [Chitinophagales bacterium]